ncbi:DUF5666 domain-containing protein [Arthrobacter sp. CJ23]|uniref:DUF5666 domain-containing protein n=1 Tax=Arthrobacter sp. CJ23 TaxID=2972479 RepID=UPI00215C4E03|nr:DUF5666 domain-containing protein [Arthrobacter sp. CJ23]UVJ40806.1 DUF5666 domain-containing protein [Arthrobacter sp. CJ23]
MSTMTPGLRKALIAGGVAVALTGGGAATVWAGTQPSPSPSGSSPSATATPSPAPSGSPGKSLGLGRLHGHGIHGEFTVKDKDGNYRTVVTQSGAVESVNDSSITVKSEDGFTQSYAINGDTRIVKIPEDVSQLRNGKGKPDLPAATAADLKAGDMVRIAGTKDGSTVTATSIVAGQLPDKLPGNGNGNGKFKGPGHHFGHNRGQNSGQNP